MGRPPSYAELRSKISRYTGLTGVEVNNILKALIEKNIDPQVVDWEKAIAPAKEYGNRYEAVWNYLRDLYGITPPWGYGRLQRYVSRGVEAEYKFNAEQLRAYLQQYPELYRRAMDALCLGRGRVPDEVEGLIPYRGEERKIFLEELCRGYVSHKYKYNDKECITQLYKPLSYLHIMPKRDDYKKVWDPEDVNKARELAREVGIAGKKGKYAQVWTEDEIEKMQEIAEKAGITGPTGKYAKCITRRDGKVIIDPDCLRDAARDAGIDDEFRKMWS